MLELDPTDPAMQAELPAATAQAAPGPQAVTTLLAQQGFEVRRVSY